MYWIIHRCYKFTIPLQVVDYIQKERSLSKDESFTLTSLEVGKGIGIESSYKAISRAMLDDNLKPYDILKIADKENNYSTTTKIRYYIKNFWLIPASLNKFDCEAAFDKWGFIDWKQRNNNYKLGDVVYVYLTAPFMRIGYKTRIIAVNQSYKDIVDDSMFWKDQSEQRDDAEHKYIRLGLVEIYNDESFNLKELLNNGLKAAPRGPQFVSSELRNYIELMSDEASTENFESEENLDNYYEGKSVQVTHTHYERNPKARQACIDYYGHDCQICGMNFEEVYGDLGKDYIEVHHIRPLSEILSEYRVNPIKDLIPICSNCHVMIHRKSPTLKPEELKQILKNESSI